MKRCLAFLLVLLFAWSASAAVKHRIPRSASAKHTFQAQTGHPRGWPGHVVDHIVPLA